MNGPTLVVVKPYYTCRGCAHLHSEYYCIEDGNDCDSGYNYFCNHPGNYFCLSDDQRTPVKCPLYPKDSP